MRQFAVIGLGNFGFSIAKVLSGKGCQVIAIDKDEEKVREISEFVDHAVQLDATEEDSLKRIGLDSIDVAIVSMGDNLESSILVTLMLKEMGVKEVISKAVTPHHAKVLQKIGADRIVFPEREMGSKIAEQLVSPDILEQIRISPNYEIIEIAVPPTFTGKTLKELGIRTKFKVNIIAIKKRVPYVNDAGESDFKEEIDLAPDGDNEISMGDVLVVMGETKKIEELCKEK